MDFGPEDFKDEDSDEYRDDDTYDEYQDEEDDEVNYPREMDCN